MNNISKIGEGYFPKTPLFCRLKYFGTEKGCQNNLYVTLIERREDSESNDVWMVQEKWSYSEINAKKLKNDENWILIISVGFHFFQNLTTGISILGQDDSNNI